jgi:hypothetical protein
MGIRPQWRDLTNNDSPIVCPTLVLIVGVPTATARKGDRKWLIQLSGNSSHPTLSGDSDLTMLF